MINNQTIFAVDDEPEVLSLYESILGVSQSSRLDFFNKLENKGSKTQYDLHTFSTGESYLQALKKYYQENKRVPLSLIDMRLPGKHGLEVAKEARLLDKEMVIIIITAYSDYSIKELLGQFEEDIYYLRKPFQEDELLAMITTNLKHWNIKVESRDIQIELAIDSTQDGLWDWNPISNEVYFSKRWKSMLGFKDNEIANDFQEWAKRIHPNELNEVMNLLHKHLEGKTPYYITEHRLLCKDGNYKWILTRGKALFNEDQKAYRMIGFHTDISERKELEKELRSMSDTLSYELESSLSNESKLKHTNRYLEEKLQNEIKKRKEQEKLLLLHTRQAAMGEMVSIIAHQWRQPITVVGLGVDSLLMDIKRDTLDVNELQESLYMIKNQINYLSQTIDDFRNFFIPNKERESIMLNECLNAALQIASQTFENGKVTIKKNFRDFSLLSLYKNEVIQVFLNILKNSYEALKEKKIPNPQISLNIIEKQDTIEAKLCDNADGIPIEHINRIFDPYFTTKAKSKGTGLGLYISKMIIEEHCCGKIEVQSDKQGSCFTITLPKNCKR